LENAGIGCCTSILYGLAFGPDLTDPLWQTCPLSANPVVPCVEDVVPFEFAYKLYNAKSDLTAAQKNLLAEQIKNKLALLGYEKTRLMYKDAATVAPTTPESSIPQPTTPETSTPQPTTPEASTPQPTTPETSTPAATNASATPAVTSESASAATSPSESASPLSSPAATNASETPTSTSGSGMALLQNENTLVIDFIYQPLSADEQTVLKNPEFLPDCPDESQVEWRVSPIEATNCVIDDQQPYSYELPPEETEAPSSAAKLVAGVAAIAVAALM
jgi:hypothetical protein